jgi:peptidoglycan-N-acetylglucosamine deacetylase
MAFASRLLGKLLLLAALLAVSTAPASAREKRIALTFDDIPRGRGAFLTPDERSEKLIAALKASGVKQAAFFLNPAKLADPDGQGGEERIAAYVKAGHVIANHSNNHIHLNETEAPAYLADVDAAELWLQGRKGYRPWFRFPYLAEGGKDKLKRDAIRAGLKARGLRNGYVTADGSDWHLEALTIQAKNDGKVMDIEALRKLYVTTQMSGVEYHDALARRALNRSPAHVMLLHETDLAALFLPDFVAELKRHGWTIITADEAFADPINKAMPDVPYSAGTLVGSMAWEKDIKPPLWPIWIGTEMMGDMFQRRVIKKVESK